MRSTPILTNTTTRWDNNLYAPMANIIDIDQLQPIHKQMMAHPTKHGGLGIYTMETRRQIHCWAAWRMTAAQSADEIYANTNTDWLENNKHTSTWLSHAAKRPQPTAKHHTIHTHVGYVASNTTQRTC